MALDPPPPPPSLPPTPPRRPSASALPPPPPVPAYAAEPVGATGAKPGRSTGAKVGIGIGLVAVVALIASLTVALSGSGAGAGSPEEAVRDFTDAVADEDIVGAITRLAPSEVGSVHELYEPLIELLVRNDALDDDGNPLQGVDIGFHDLELEVERLHDDIGKVRIIGGRVTLDVTVDELDSHLAEGAGAEDLHQEFDLADLDALLADANAELGTFADQNGVDAGEISDVFLMTVREGDRWYVSPMYTFVEVAREALGLPQPGFGSWREQVGPGADSPGAVLDSFASALSSLDSDTLADAIESGEPVTSLEIEGALAPGEFAAFFDYMPVFEQWIEQTVSTGLTNPGAEQQEFADMLRDFDIDLSVDVDSEDRKLADDRAKVVVRGARFEMHANGRVDGEALRSDVLVEVYDGLCADISAEVLSGGVVEPFEASECADGIAGTDFDGVFVVAVKRDGGWYFSPTETLVEYGRLAIDAALAS